MRSLVLAVALVAALFPVAASAQTITPVAGSPIVLTACKLDLNRENAGYYGNFVVGNRTSHALSAVRIAYVVYDTEGVRMDQTARDYTLPDSILPGDVSSVPASMGFSIAYGKTPLISRVSCRVQAALFSGNKKWTYGQRWPEKLVPLAGDSTGESGGGEGSGKTAPPVAASRADIVVTNSWNDVVGGVTYVHTALSVTANAQPLNFDATRLQLSMALTNGARKTYAALSSGAPTYQKINPLGSTTVTAYEVTPSEDLGRLGTLAVPAHGQVRVVATFAVSDALANPNENRAVTLK